MGYGLVGKFIDKTNRKLLGSYDMDFLKNLNDCGYSSTFSDIESTSTTVDSDFPEVTVSKEIIFKSFYKNDILQFLSPKSFQEYTTPWCYQEYDAYIVNPEVLDSIKDFLVDDYTKDKENLVAVFCIEEINYNGTWYTFKDISDGRDKIQKEYEEAQEEVRRLRNMKNSIQYFEMSENGKNDLLSELKYAEDSLEEWKWNLDSVNSLYYLFDNLAHNLYYNSYDEFGVEHISASWRNKRNVEVFIEVL
jgi:hypothetical protein